MFVPVLKGLIERRLLVNYRVDPEILAQWLPAPFRPQVVAGFGIAGICMIRLRDIRPRLWPERWGISSENAAHRVAVEWSNGESTGRGVYVHRRDTSSRFNALVGGMLFPGRHYRARFEVRESPDRLEVRFVNRDGTEAAFAGRLVNELPAGSVFSTLAQASEFFEEGALGYSPARERGKYDGLELRPFNWSFTPLQVEHVVSSVFSDRQSFPEGSIAFDSAFVMRHVRHEWLSREPLCCTERYPAAARPEPGVAGALASNA